MDRADKLRDQLSELLRPVERIVSWKPVLSAKFLTSPNALQARCTSSKQIQEDTTDLPQCPAGSSANCMCGNICRTTCMLRSFIYLADLAQKKRGWRGAHATHLLFVPLIKRVLPDHCRSPGAYGKSPIVDVYSSRISKGILKRAYSTTGGNSKLVSRNCRVAGSWAQVSSYIGSEPAGSTFSHSDSMPAASFRLVTLAALTSLIPLI